MPPAIAATVAWTGTVAVRSRIAASCHRRCDREALPPARARGSGWCTLGQACLAGLPVGCVLGPSEPRGVGCEVDLGGRRIIRSEEHTSELQSHLNLVCRLLLEKKKRKLRISRVTGTDSTLVDHTVCGS